MRAYYAAPPSVPLMSNIAILLKNEITRLSKKVVRQQTEPVRAASVAQRRQLAQLRQKVVELQKDVAAIQRSAKAHENAPRVAETNSNLRFVAKGFKNLRGRLGLSAEDTGLILGVSSQSVFNWENGKTKPRASQLPAIAALRTMGKRDAQARLAEIASTSKRKKRLSKP